MYNYNTNDINDPNYQAAYRRAEHRVRAKLGFYWHLASYVLVNGMLIIIYLITGPLAGGYNYPWFVWPMFGWGIGLLFHFLGVFVFSNSNSEQMRRRMIEEEMRRMGVQPPAAASWSPTPPPTSYQTSVPPDQTQPRP